MRTFSRVPTRVSAAVVLGMTILAAGTPVAGAAPVVQPLGAFGERAQVAARGSTTALALQDPSRQFATLLFSVDGIPVPAPGAGRLPIWARPSIGTDASGSRVVIYPRCTTAEVSSCDLYRYDPASATERPVAGVNRSGVGEVDGAMDRGAVAFNRWTDGTTSPASGFAAQTTRLYYKSHSHQPRLISKRGGRQLALQGTWIAQVRDTRKQEDSEIGQSCGVLTVELVRLSGKRRTVRKSPCGESGQSPVNPMFAGGFLVWAATWTDRPGQLFRYRIAERSFRQVRLPKQLDTFAASSVRGGVGYRCVEPGECTADRVTGMSFASAEDRSPPN